MLQIPKRIYFFAIALAALFFFLHLSASRLFWYYSISWFDALMHFGGGVLCAAAYVTYEHLRGKKEVPVSLLITVVAIVAGAWEAYEYFLQNHFRVDGIATYLDSLSDFSFGIAGAGALVALILFVKRGKMYNRSI